MSNIFVRTQLNNIQQVRGSSLDDHLSIGVVTIFLPHLHAAMEQLMFLLRGWTPDNELQWVRMLPKNVI